MSPARNGRMSLYRETSEGSSAYRQVTLTSILVSFMAGVPYVPDSLPISY